MARCTTLPFRLVCPLTSTHDRSGYREQIAKVWLNLAKRTEGCRGLRSATGLLTCDLHEAGNALAYDSQLRHPHPFARVHISERTRLGAGSCISPCANSSTGSGHLYLIVCQVIYRDQALTQMCSTTALPAWMHMLLCLLLLHHPLLIFLLTLQSIMPWRPRAAPRGRSEVDKFRIGDTYKLIRGTSFLFLTLCFIYLHGFSLLTYWVFLFVFLQHLNQE